MGNSRCQSTVKKKLTDAKSERLQDKLRQQYKEANKKVKRRVRTDRRFYVDNLAVQAEVAAAKGELGQINKITKLVCGKHSNKLDPPLKTTVGSFLLVRESSKNARLNSKGNFKLATTYTKREYSFSCFRSQHQS